MDLELVIKKREERRRMKEIAKMKRKVKECGEDSTGELPSLFVPKATKALASQPGQLAPPIKQAERAALPSNGPPYLNQVPATPIFHPCSYQKIPETTGSVHRNLESARVAEIWTFPPTLLEQARCASFRKVREEGYYLGHGVKFGGEFSIYPGE